MMTLVSNWHGDLNTLQLLNIVVVDVSVASLRGVQVWKVATFKLPMGSLDDPSWIFGVNNASKICSCAYVVQGVGGNLVVNMTKINVFKYNIWNL